MKNSKIIIGIIVLLVGGYFVLDSILFDGFKPKSIHENGFQGEFFSGDSTLNKTAVVVIGGGQYGHYWGVQAVDQGLVGLALPYTRKEGLPKLPEEIPLEYFENAIKWLREQPEVNPNKIIVMGASRNAELALVIASTFPELVSGVIAYAPSAVSWSNTVLPYNSDALKPSWTYKGADIPYVPMDKIKGGDNSVLNTLAYWEEGLQRADDVNQAIIKVEKINGPILLLSGKNDKVWPSAQMADRLAERIGEHDFPHAFKNIQYENAGHLISNDPEASSDQRTGNMTIAGKSYAFEFGGTTEGDNIAKQKAKAEVIAFIHGI